MKFMAQTDLDEMFAHNSATFLNFLQEQIRNFPLAASFSFLSQRAHLEVRYLKTVRLFQKSLNIVKSPNNMNFDHLENVNLEGVVFERNIYSKNAYRPERVCINRETSKFLG